MLTCNVAPWVEYLEIDEETGERRLRENTPQEIQDKYEAYLVEQSNNSSDMLPK